MDDLSGRRVLLTGASRGIGAATARILGEAGADVVAHYGSYEQGAAEAVAGLGHDRSLLVQADLARPGSARELWSQAVAWKGSIDVLVVNAAVMPETPWDATDDDWDSAWETAVRVNLLEPASLVREAVNHFRANGGGTLITLSSWAAQRGSAIPQLTAYAATKSAVKTLTQTVARNHAQDGVLAYVVAPGIVRTRLSEISAASRGGIDAVNAQLAMGEMVPADEVARLIAWLATGTCRHLTGATLDVNGASYIR